MKIISWNVNGIRACVNKGAFFDYMKKEDPDVICLQEIKALESDLDESVRQPAGYHAVWHSAEKKGYSGTAILSKKAPLNVVEGMGNEKYDREGRVLMAEYDDFVLFSVYFPNGQQGPHRLEYKLDFYQDFFDYCEEYREAGKAVIVSGDYNTAHTEIDLARPKENEETSGFMPIERDWLDEIVKRGYVDTFRMFNSDPENYTWWSYRTRARARNVGWRIDYFFVTDDIKDKVADAFIRQEAMGSDHCPVGITLKL